MKRAFVLALVIVPALAVGQALVLTRAAHCTGSWAEIRAKKPILWTEGHTNPKNQI